MTSKRSHRHIISALTIAFSFSLSSWFLSSCQDDPDDETAPRPVIEAWIDSDGYPEVLFTSSVVPGNDGSISNNVINWGKVTISDGEKEIIMTGGPYNSYIPPYRYYTLEMTGEPGRTYTITATYRNLKAEAKAYMPCPTPIDSITVGRIENDTLRSASLHFTAPSDTPAFYYLTISDPQPRAQQFPCMLGTAKAMTPGAHISIPIFHHRQKIDGVTFVPQLKVGEQFIVRLNRISEKVYNFWSAYDNMVNFSSSPFISTDQSLPSNINGGFGIFSAKGSSPILIHISDSPLPYTVLP